MGHLRPLPVHATAGLVPGARGRDQRRYRKPELVTGDVRLRRRAHGSGWVGVRTASHVTPNISGLLIHPDFVPAPKGAAGAGDGHGDSEGGGEDGGSEKAGGTGGSGSSGKSKAGEGSGSTGATQFYAQFDLDSVRGIKQLGKILEHVTARLGPNVELSLEIRATNEVGYDDATQRIVTENASNLGANGPEFEA